VKTIFAEPQLSSKAARVIAAEIGGAVLVLDPVGGEGIAGRDSYLALMRYNLATIGAGMK
jgi:ABC-type Zn uptake system ZnuABC Zn-binding protein ZnuA